MKHTVPTVKTDFTAPVQGGVQTWLEENSTATRNFLLAFAQDGVIWGIFNGALQTSAPINQDTLLQAFLFGRDDELRLFCGDDGNWQACLIADQGVSTEDMIDEYQLLWGSEVVEPMDANGFTRVRDRVQQALEHSVPLNLSAINLDQEGPRLLVRHFIEYDQGTGEARIYLSRLVALGIGPLDEEKFK